MPQLRGLARGEVPEWLHFPYITRGYRLGGSARECWASLFCITRNNEALNAWTTLASLAAGTAMMLWCVAGVGAASADAVPFVAMWLGQAVHHPLSAAYHVLLPMSPEAYHAWRQRDMAGIFALNACATLGLAWFTFGRLAALGCAAAGACVGCLGARAVLRMRPGEPLDRARVVALVLASCLGYYAPVLYRGVRATVERRVDGAELWGAVGMVGSHGLGAALFVLNVPERLVPGVFDCVGNSHNLMHVLVFGAYVYGYAYLWALRALQQG